MLSYYVLACLLLVISFTDVTTGMYCFIFSVFCFTSDRFFYDEFESAIAPPLNSHVLCTITFSDHL